MQRRTLLAGLGAGLVAPGTALAVGRMRLSEFVAELASVADAMEEDPTVQADFDAFVEDRGLAPTASLRRDFARVKLAFEATRDGGWWHLRWDITNRKPNSEEIWAQWRESPSLFDAAGEPVATATAECDELSALFAFVGRKLGVGRLGLFWPEWNHVVAVWSVTQGETTHRIVVPTSQIFLDADASLGTRGFNPWKQKTIFTYRRKDVSERSSLPQAFAKTLIDQAWRHAFEDPSTAQKHRNARSRALDGS